MSKKKIERLSRIAEMAKHHEKIQLIHWKKAKDELNDSKEQFKKLNGYFQNYAHELDQGINAKLYSNKQQILTMVSSAIVEQKQTISSLEKVEASALELLKSKTQDRKIYEKLIEKKQKTLESLDRKKEDTLLQEIQLRHQK